MSQGREGRPVGCRPVTPEEVAHYAEHGWAMLPGFLTAGMAATLLAMAKARMALVRLLNMGGSKSLKVGMDIVFLVGSDREEPRIIG